MGKRPLPQGALANNSTGIGPVTQAKAHLRTQELALLAGFTAPHVRARLSGLKAGLFSLVIPKDKARQYGTALKTDKFVHVEQTTQSHRPETALYSRASYNRFTGKGKHSPEIEGKKQVNA